MQWITSKRVKAGVINNIEYNELDPAIKEQFRVLAETQPIPRAVVMYRDQLDPAVAKALTAVLTSMNSNNARDILTAFDATSQFDALTAAQLQELQNLYELAQK